MACELLSEQAMASSCAKILMGSFCLLSPLRLFNNKLFPLELDLAVEASVSYLEKSEWCLYLGTNSAGNLVLPRLVESVSLFLMFLLFLSKHNFLRG
jgi:hypothetical protein